MTATYRLAAGELTEDFLEALRRTFRQGDIAITVEELPDETDYLLASEANRRDLLEAVEAERAGRFYRSMTLEAAEALAGAAERP